MTEISILSVLGAAFDFVERAFVFDSAGWFIMFILALAGYTLLYQMLDDNGPAILGTPILMLGAALGQLTLREFGQAMASDKTVNMGIGMAGGMFVSSVLIVGILWAWGRMANR